MNRAITILALTFFFIATIWGWWYYSQNLQGGAFVTLTTDNLKVISTSSQSGATSSIAAATTSTDDLLTEKIKLESLKANDLIENNSLINGWAPGNWYFEASFPIELVYGSSTDLKTVTTILAQAQSDWMTTGTVPFIANLNFLAPTSSDMGVLIFKKDNPSGLPENDDKFELPVRFR